MDIVEKIKRSGSIALLTVALLIAGIKMPDNGDYLIDLATIVPVLFSFFLFWYLGASLLLSHGVFFVMLECLRVLSFILGSVGLLLILPNGSYLILSGFLSWALLPKDYVRRIYSDSLCVDQLQANFISKVKFGHLMPAMRMALFHSLLALLVYCCCLSYLDKNIYFSFELLILFICLYQLRENFSIRVN